MYDADRLSDLYTTRGPFVRVVVAEARGSTPREVGAEMAVFADATLGTIGGGALEHEAIAQARARLAPGAVRFPLGPALGQCCGGSVTVLFEPIRDGARPVEGPQRALRVDGAPAPPLWVERALARARRGEGAVTRLAEGWFMEPTARPARDLWIWGAGHVGREVAALMAGLPGWRITWIDTAADRFPDTLPAGVTRLVAADPGAATAHAPTEAHHLVFTFSHAIDLDLCHRLLGHGFASLGLIGSATKWVRFRKRLAALGHAPQAIDRITCPIGDPMLGKHPRAIAVGVAARLLREAAVTSHQRKARA